MEDFPERLSGVPRGVWLGSLSFLLHGDPLDDLREEARGPGVGAESR